MNVATPITLSDSVGSQRPGNTSLDHDVDLILLLSQLWLGRKKIILIVLLFMASGLAVGYFLPQKWTSRALITDAEIAQTWELNRAIREMQLLAIDTARLDISHSPQEGQRDRLDMHRLLVRFLKKYNSPSLITGYLSSLPWTQTQLKDAQAADSAALHKAVTIIAEKMVSEPTYAATKKNETKPYTSWTLAFTAPMAEDAQKVLSGYNAYITSLVRDEVLADLRQLIELKIDLESTALQLDKAILATSHTINLEKLHYALDVASAAGIKRPVFSNGQAVKDDPDYAITLGTDGLAQKLKIEQSLVDVSKLNLDIQKREQLLRELRKLNIDSVRFTPVSYMLEPSLPIKKDGPGRLIVLIIATLTGILAGCGIVLLQNALRSVNAENGKSLTLLTTQ